MKTLKVEGVYPLEFETADDVTQPLPASITKYNAKRLHSSLGYLSPEQYEKHQTRLPAKDAARHCPAHGAHSKKADRVGGQLAARGYPRLSAIRVRRAAGQSGCRAGAAASVAAKC